MMSLGYRKKQSIALIASALVHAAVVAVVLMTPRKETTEPVVVELVEPADSNSSVSAEQKAVEGDLNAQGHSGKHISKDASSGSDRTNQKQKNSDHFDIKKFASSTRENLRHNRLKEIEGEIASRATQENTSTDGMDSREGNDLGMSNFGGDPMAGLEVSSGGFSSAVQYSNLMGLEFTNESLGFFQALHRRVDGPLVYPEDFSRQRLTGKVRIEAELRSDGTLIRFLSTVADNDILQVYSLAYLSHVLSQPLPLRSHLKYDRAVVSFDFDFRVRVAGTNPVTLETGYRKNHLLFARESLVDPLLNEKINEIFTHYVPPIIPLPGGFYVDFIAAFQYFKNLKEGNPTESEARLRRIETLHEKLKQSIRSGKPS